MCQSGQELKTTLHYTVDYPTTINHVNIETQYTIGLGKQQMLEMLNNGFDQ